MGRHRCYLYHLFMKLLLRYLKPYKWMIVLALVLVSINQVFSLLNPWILGNYIIDPYANQTLKGGKFYGQVHGDEFFHGIILGLLMIIGAARSEERRVGKECRSR